MNNYEGIPSIYRVPHIDTMVKRAKRKGNFSQLDQLLGVYINSRRPLQDEIGSWHRDLITWASTNKLREKSIGIRIGKELRNYGDFSDTKTYSQGLFFLHFILEDIYEYKGEFDDDLANVCIGLINRSTEDILGQVDGRLSGNLNTKINKRLSILRGYEDRSHLKVVS